MLISISHCKFLLSLVYFGYHLLLRVIEYHIIVKAIKMEISRSLGIKMRAVVIRVEVVVGTQMKVEDDVGSGMIMKVMVIQGTDGGVMVILGGERLVTVPAPGGETEQMVTMQGQEENVSHGVVVIPVS